MGTIARHILYRFQYRKTKWGHLKKVWWKKIIFTEKYDEIRRLDGMYRLEYMYQCIRICPTVIGKKLYSKRPLLREIMQKKFKRNGLNLIQTGNRILADQNGYKKRGEEKMSCLMRWAMSDLALFRSANYWMSDERLSDERKGKFKKWTHERQRSRGKNWVGSG